MMPGRWLLSAGALAAALLLTAALLYWALRDIPLAEIGRVLAQLQPWQIAVILLVNAAIIQLFALRWWLVLRAQSYAVPFAALSRYRLAAFAVSFITPGQHIGGEPLQVLFLRRHSVSTDAAAASVALDRVVEYFANTAVLVAGLTILLHAGLFAELPLRGALPVLLLLLALVAAYLLAAGRGWRPLARLLRKKSGGLALALISAEQQLGALAASPRLLLLCLLPSLLTWAALFFETWLMLRYLGLDLDSLGVLAVSMAGRIAQFSPTPGALGAIEASQVLAMRTLGLNPAYAIALSLLIHARDIFFTVVGMALGGAEGLSAYRRARRLR
jgi:uncharacterized protein (TIRG00374 family)